jgi:F0F1-type ATP synthase membrane subunit b/b'
MAADTSEEELLRSIEEVEARIQKFRKQVRAVLASAQTEGKGTAAENRSQSKG